MALSSEIDEYRRARPFGDRGLVEQFLSEPRVFARRKAINFDEVENANVWSFYLVDRDLHHTFEEYVIDRKLPAYSRWSRDPRILDPQIERATFPISETASRFFPPVPEPGDFVRYVMEVIDVGESSIVLGFVAFRERDREIASRASLFALWRRVFALWRRVFVKYDGASRTPAAIPRPVAAILKTDATRVFAVSK